METLKKYAKKYFIDAMSAMALGLFASLLIGTIFGTIGTYLGPDYIANGTVNAIGGFFTEMKTFAQGASGMAIGVAIAYSLKAHPLVMFSCAAVGSLSYSLGATIAIADGESIAYTAGPAGAYIAVIFAAEIGMLVSKKTKVDILVTPTVTIIAGYAIAKIICPAVAYILAWRLYKHRDGNAAASFGFYHRGCSRNDSHPAHFFRGNLRYDRNKRNCGRRCNSRLLCSDDRFCGNQLCR